MRFRLFLSCLIFLCISSALSCNRKDASLGRNKKDGISLGQDVTNTLKPQDVIFVDFERNWKKFISSSPQFTLPVVAKEPSKRAPWQPIVQEDCVFSPDAGGNVPQVTLTWNDSAAPNPVPTPQLQSQQQRKNETSAVRFDLALHYQGFERNYYTTVLSTDKLQRFNLPSNSALISNPDALLLTGPGLFPKLIDFHTEMVQQNGTNVEVPRQTLVVRDFAPGLAYTLREAILGNNQWTEDRKFAFSTPVCPREF